MPGRRISRRAFLQRAAVLAAPYVLPLPAIAKALRPPPSRRITAALIGCGGMGGGHLDNLLGRGDVQLLAVCDVDRTRRRDAQAQAHERYGETVPSGLYRGVEDYNDFREILARDDVDAVWIATPDHWHVPIAVAAARAGKDVYCEKPVSHTVGQGRLLADAFSRHGRIFQTGSWQRSVRDFRFAAELVRNGRLGRVDRIEVGLPGGQQAGPQPAQPVPDGFDYDFWLGPAPWAPYTEKRCHYNFRWNFDYAAGPIGDWGPHHLDIVQWALGTDRSGPVKVEGAGEIPRDGLYDTPVRYKATFGYPDGTTVTATDAAENGIKFDGARGWVFVSREALRAEPKTLLEERIGPTEIRLYKSDDHAGNFLDGVRTRRETVTPAEIAHRSATMAHLANIAILLGRPLRWDPARERFVGDAQADRMLDRPLRAPWRV